VGFGNIAPNTPNEKIYAVAVMMIGCKYCEKAIAMEKDVTTENSHVLSIATTHLAFIVFGFLVWPFSFTNLPSSCKGPFYILTYLLYSMTNKLSCS
jgi:hypothetical protein